METFFQLLFGGLQTGSVTALAALGIAIIYRTSRTTNFAQGTIGMFNAFIATFGLIHMNMTPWMAAIFGMLASFLTGVAVDLLIIRQAKKSSPIAKQIITFGIIMIFLGAAPMLFGVVPLSFPSFLPTGHASIMGAAISHNALLNIFIGVVAAGLLFLFLQYTRWGLAVRVTASNETTAKLMGVPTSHVTMGAWAVAAALGTLSALMLAPAISVNVSMMDTVQINALIAGVIGGFQTFYGPVLAAYIIGVSRNLLLFYVSSTWGEPLLFMFILLFIVLRPNGLIGKKIVKKV
ncbi:MAG: branched-chain amino acid ABC transporter permease [Defluviitaleaceae bacterium]|nr:branched-chain amino acid ABC transporter permease [Defluviitaleaceae bacterium]